MKRSTKSTDTRLVHLLRRAKEGDLQARRELFSLLGDEKRHGAVVLAIARQLLPKAHRARRFLESRDIMQSALRTGWHDVTNFRGKTKAELYAWLRAILRTKVNRATRKQNRDLYELEFAETEASTRDQPSPLSDLIDSELRDKLRRALKLIPAKQRIVIYFRLNGFSAIEVSQVLGLKEATVRKRESRALERLRALMN